MGIEIYFQVNKMNQLKSDLRKFTKDRNWEQYHWPKNLAMALSVEVAELVEIFQWKREYDLLTNDEYNSLRDEIGDIMIYLIMIADKFELDPLEMARCKMKKNEKKHPINV